MNRFSFNLCLLIVIAGSLSLPGVIANAATYDVTEGAYNGTRHAAQRALNEGGGCSGLTQNKLVALMLSVPVWEVAGGARGRSVSPMTLSRWDGWSLRTENRRLYSHVEYPSFKRAHWNPGIGMWQLDTWSSTLHLNHGERMDTNAGGIAVARYLRDGYCAGTTTVKSRLNNNWFACRWDKCWNTFNDMYIDASDSLDVNRTAGSEWDGGVSRRSCRWGSGNSFACFWVNTNLRQGWMDTSDPNGDGARTPLAAGFLALSTSSGRRYAIWLRSSGLGKEIGKSVPTGQGARDGDNWYDGSSLEVYKCGASSCWWSQWGIVL